MFSSIRWRFVTVYFLLVFIAMSIVGIFIVEKLESQQLDSILGNMERQIESIIQGSTYISKDSWSRYQDEIQDTINNWRLGSKDSLYIIDNKDLPTIIASTSKDYSNLIGENALSSKYMDPQLILSGFNGEKVDKNIRELNEDIYNKHLAYPVISDLGEVKGLIYMTSDLSQAYETIREARLILTNATILALVITIFLGFLISSSITTPISDLTKKAEEMARGDFNQFVEVKSDDEIGQLANMFNYLTLELKNRIEEIDYERSKLDTIFTYMDEGVIALNKENEIIHANIIAMNILDLDRRAIDREEKIDFEDIGIDRIDYEDLSSLKGTQTISKGREIYKIKYAPFKNKKDINKENIGGVIIVLQDITKDHKLDKMRKEFVANVSHELKTPITTVKSYTETLLEQDVDEKTQVDFLGIIDREADRMNRLVRDLLQLSNLDYKKAKWNKLDLDINKLVSEVSYKLVFSKKYKIKDIDLDLHEGLPKIYADRYAIEQVVSNIISNAIKYIDKEDSIYIKTYQYSQDAIAIDIEDNGPGIGKRDLDRIFERFYRVEKGRSRELGGTGLGLSIAKEIVESHKGDLRIDSSLGQGTRVTIILPKGNKNT